ncbi:MAG: Grx4 family monothiol glutaredoxin [Chiayiivirga sp.]|jgi:monothiol glutaredoxin|uniref:Grx4 family monothiol glutaredoxin n=1 Tax=Chiayiivirga sp. TaxID=2041042 RepID=UPI0025BF06BC|nr:Grx4 family monothiol glutaredoxin [Chiayiivirga sp.]MCI1711836.1 Grx4 family monothiol glutaredoxin [Chiayiivirga sp.]MCI1729579.1 Grx4 family monothiol glutaredoxin [Chiayiivirga sp.]
MSLDPSLRQRIEALLAAHPVVLFMKGTPEAPRCGFSAKAVGALSGIVEHYESVDVLADADIREGIKAYGSWPTIPQLYVKGELVGGSDIIESMLNSGELHALFGQPAPDRTPPSIHITPAAADAIRNALDNSDPSLALHLGVDARFNAQFQLKPVNGKEIVSEAAGLRIHFDLVSAQRAKGLEIDWVEDARGAGLAIRNPNAPPAVKSLSVQELHDHIIAGTVDVIDVRPAHARATAPFPQPHEVLDEDSRARLEALPKDLPLAFLCHHGNSSRQAAEHFRNLGFHDLYNVEGGIDAWSAQIDPRVPRY